MRILLDTHVAVWATIAPELIPARVRDMILGADEHYVSMASYWELAVKSASGRTSTLPMGIDAAMFEFGRAGLKTLNTTFSHVQAVASLRLEHGDPFDRLILAQSIVEPLRLVTKDRHLAAYSDAIISW